jgi:hypothetical protein
MRTNHFNSDSRVMAVESQTVTNRLDLDALGVVEMNDAEMRETDGGITIFKMEFSPFSLIVLGIKIF